MACVTVQHPPSKTPVDLLHGHGRVKGNDRADRLVGKAIVTNGFHLKRSEMLRSLRHYLQAHCQGHHTIDCLEEKGMESGNVLQFSFKRPERAKVNEMTTGTVSKATLGKLLRDGLQCRWAFPSA